MTAAAFEWRPAVAADLPALAALYEGAARTWGPRVYTPAQVAAWAGFAHDGPGFGRYVLENDTWVAERPGEAGPLGFCGAHRDGEPREISSLYVRAGATRQGVGGIMLDLTLERARLAGARHFAAWVTPFSRPVFERAGFRLVRTVVEPFAGRLFERYRVELDPSFESAR